MARDDRAADVDGWVTVTNNSGTAFRNATLQLVAGDLNRVRQQLNRMVAMEDMAARAAAPAPMAQEAFSDYHLYTLGRKTTINNAQTKQVSMLSGSGVPVRKRYVVEGQQAYYHNRHHPGSPLKDVVQVYYQLTNAASGGLGVPMPAGTVRVYQHDSKGAVQFVGEGRINHTPKDETLNLKIGNAFDVVCERNQTDFQKIGGSTYEVEWIALRNRKATPISVEVNEPIGGTGRSSAARTRRRRPPPGRRASRCPWPPVARRRCATVSGSSTRPHAADEDAAAAEGDVERLTGLPGHVLAGAGGGVAEAGLEGTGDTKGVGAGRTVDRVGAAAIGVDGAVDADGATRLEHANGAAAVAGMVAPREAHDVARQEGGRRRHGGEPRSGGEPAVDLDALAREPDEGLPGDQAGDAEQGDGLVVEFLLVRGGRDQRPAAGGSLLRPSGRRGFGRSPRVRLAMWRRLSHEWPPRYEWTLKASAGSML